MIIYRVAIGRGWTHKTLRQVNSTVESTLRFNTMGTRTTTHGTGNASRLANLGSDVASSTDLDTTADRSHKDKDANMSNGTDVVICI
jgi:hypothetical protein